MRLIRALCGPLFVFAGVMHFLRPDLYRPMMPAWLPAHDELIYASGVTEVAGGLAIACPQPRVRRIGGVILLLTLAGVFPANVQMAIDHERFRQIPREALYARLPFQLVFVAWVLAAMKPPAGR